MASRPRRPSASRAGADPVQEARGRALADSLRRAAEIAEGEGAEDVRARPDTLPGESQGFEEGVRAGVLTERHLREHICADGRQPLGPYVPAPERGVSLHEQDELVRFPPHLQALFKLLTPPRAAALGKLAVRLADRQTVIGWWRGGWKWAAGIVVATFAAARWGRDQVPFLREIAAFVRAHLP